jgi:hypothetical protein
MTLIKSLLILTTGATTCDNNGGCDYHTNCTINNGKLVCSPCPEGMAGEGITECTSIFFVLYRLCLFVCHRPLWKWSVQSRSWRGLRLLY